MPRDDTDGRPMGASTFQPFTVSLFHCYTILCPGNDLLFQDLAVQVPSALEGLTTVFGMGTGVTPPLLSPGMYLLVGNSLWSVCKCLSV